MSGRRGGAGLARCFVDLCLLKRRHRVLMEATAAPLVVAVLRGKNFKGSDPVYIKLRFLIFVCGKVILNRIP